MVDQGSTTENYLKGPANSYHAQQVLLLQVVFGFCCYPLAVIFLMN